MQKSEITIQHPDTIGEYNLLQEIWKDGIIEDTTLGNLLFSYDEYKPLSFEDAWDKKIFKDWFIIKDKSAILGMCKLSPRFPIGYKRVNHNYILGPMYIKPEFRGHGYGKLLLKGSMKEIENKSVINISLWVKENNLTAIRLYESEGFEIIGREKGYTQFEGNYTDCLIMQLIIKKSDPI